MEKIEHTSVISNGIKIHVASIGSGPVVLLLHGFPELWYSWRHQLLSLASLGYRAIAPDLRGYGDTDAPSSPSSYSALHIVGDIVGLLDALGIEQVFLVGHDFGAVMAWYFCLLRPERVKALVNLSVAFMPRNPRTKPLESMRSLMGDDYYICRFQRPGEAEEEFTRAGTARIIMKFLTSRNPRPPCVPKEIGFGGKRHTPITLPSWLSEEDVHYYVSKFDQKGFTGGLNYYRALDLNVILQQPAATQKRCLLLFVASSKVLCFGTQKQSTMQEPLKQMDLNKRPDGLEDTLSWCKQGIQAVRGHG